MANLKSYFSQDNSKKRNLSRWRNETVTEALLEFEDEREWLNFIHFYYCFSKG